MTPTIVTWLWRGERDYRAEHVAALGEMLHRHMTGDYRFVAFSDEPGDYGPHVEVFPIPDGARALKHLRTPEQAHFPTCYRRLWLFSHNARALGDRVLLTDVDVVVTGDWSPLFDQTADFVGWKPGQVWGNVERRVAGGMWLLRTGSHTEVWEDFIADPALAIKTARAADFRGSDQAWISFKLARHASIWPEGSGIYSVRDFTRDDRNRRVHSIPADARVVHFNGINKPWDKAAQYQHPWIKQYWPEGIPR